MFEIEFRKKKVTINRPFQVGIDVYQLAKLRMLQFYYDCLDYFIHIWGSHAKRSKERSGRSVSKIGSDKKELVCMRQMEQSHAGVQAGVRRNP